MKWLPILLLIATHASAQSIPNFELPNSADGNNVSLVNLASDEGVVVVFFSNTCPYDGYYLDRLLSLNSKIPVVLINSHRDEAESVQAMKSYLYQHKVTLPYLADKDQKVFNLFNPRKTPECFLLKNSGGKFSLVYHGAIDDNAQSANEVNHPYLLDALGLMLAGKKIETPEVRPVGCSTRVN